MKFYPKIHYCIMAIMLLLPFYAKAADETSTCLTIEKNDGTSEHYYLSDKPVLTIENEMLHLKSNLAEIDIKRADIQTISFTQRGAGIDEIATDSNDYIVVFDGNILKISRINNSAINVYDIGGRKIKTAQAYDNAAEIDMQPMAPGIYVVSIPGKPALKICKK